jgi:hypothetical protein
LSVPLSDPLSAAVSACPTEVRGKRLEAYVQRGSLRNFVTSESAPGARFWEDDDERGPMPDESEAPVDEDGEDLDVPAIAMAPAWQRCRACEHRIPTDAECCPWCSRPIHFDLAEASDSAGIVAPGRLR